MQPSNFGPYRVVRLIGQGGMGAVYEAVDPDSGRTVAVKTLLLHLADDEGVRRRFEAEIETLRKFKHPGIAEMKGWGSQDGLPFFAMEYVSGETLEALLRSGKKFTWQQATAITLEVLRVLKAAHDHGVFHRDLKPANLMFRPAAGGGFNVVVTDFGIAKLFGETGLTRSGAVVGTPEYMSPEQAAGHVVDQRGDLYSLGLVMFAMLAGKPPFNGDVAAVMECQKSRKPPRISRIVPGIPEALDDLIDRLLEKSPGRRPANAVVVAKLLADVTGSAPAPPPADTKAATGDLMPTVPARRDAPPGQATTIVTDAEGRVHGDRKPVAKKAANQAANDHSPHGGSSYTTVEQDARARRKRDESRDRRHKWLAAAGATMMIAATAFGGWHLVRHVFFPTSDEVYRDILVILGDPKDLREPCGWIRSFLKRWPDDSRVDDVRRMGREKSLERLARRSRLRRLRWKPDANRTTEEERLFMEAIIDEDQDRLDDATRKLQELIAQPRRPIEQAAAAVAINPCEVAERPDLAAWQELARRRLVTIGLKVEEQRQRAQAALKDGDRAKAMLRQADALQTKIDDPATSAPNRVIAIVQQHEILEDLVDTYAGKPDAADQVREARQLLGADR
jgi:serine/threonine-protein kinase